MFSNLLSLFSSCIPNSGNGGLLSYKSLPICCLANPKSFSVKKPGETSRYYGNISGLKDKQTEKQLLEKQQKNDHGTSSWIYLYCSDDGLFDWPDQQKIPNIVLKTWYNEIEGPSSMIYQLYSNGTLTDKAIYEVVQTEYGINARKIRDLEQFVSTKIKQIKQAQGVMEAWRWARTYTYVMETTCVATMWSVYKL